ncbi:acyl-CoA dehydrogenase family protein [Gordonia sp. Z-3]|jgi:alkylation response protein AidB-like acyl-CoA dehydrogenase|uniref:acyl-CoA dehydrogenase family protein n=1 Tax=Gordonia sp. Z-3 TaxID=3115408 RepID=UPI002E2BCB2A|nr:acyl-CoA dehydrogenase family protein [Gordonia sp. Z-3]MED5801997.1 acyl-CoA dehydrogenase family protein [Gordonia sp. Z-3]
MDFTYPETADDVRGLTRDIVTTISTPERVATLEESGAPVDAELWRELGAAGLLGLEVASSLAGERGGDLSAIENTVVAEELGRAIAQVPFAAHACAALPVAANRGSRALRDSVIGPAAGGEQILTVAFEEDLGVDVAAPTAIAVVDDARVTLTGTKINVPYAEAAHAFVVNAAGPDGPLAVLVPSETPGVAVRAESSTGKIPTGQVDFTEAVVDTDQVLNGGVAAVRDVAERLTLAVCAEQSGIVTRALELTAEYAREREQFGRAIGSFQAVAQRLADGYIDAQGLSLTTIQAAWMLANFHSDAPTGSETDLRTAIATAKFWATEAGHRIAHTTVHVHGGVGLDTSHPVHRYFLRAKQNEFTLGSAPVVLAAIGADLAATPA